MLNAVKQGMRQFKCIVYGQKSFTVLVPDGRGARQSGVQDRVGFARHLLASRPFQWVVKPKAISF